MKTIGTVVVAMFFVIFCGMLINDTWLSAYVKDKVGIAENNARNDVSIEYIIKMAKQDPAKSDAILKAEYVKATLATAGLEGIKNDRDQMKAQLAINDNAIKQAHAWMAKNDPSKVATIDGKEYTYVQIKEDAKLRISECNTLRNSISAVNVSINELAANIALSKKNIINTRRGIELAQTKIAAKESEVRVLAAVLKSREVAKVFKPNTFVAQDITAGKFFQELNRRAVEMNAEIEYENFTGAETTTSGSTVPWSDEGVQSKNEIDEYFQKHLAAPKGDEADLVAPVTAEPLAN